MSSSNEHRFNASEVEAYEKKRYRGFDQRLVHWREERIIRKLLADIAASSQPGSLFLDAPCGYGRFSRLILQHGFFLVSSDLSLAMVERARAKGFKSHSPIGIVANMKTGLPFRSGAFSAALSMRFFHHLHQPEERKAVLRELHRVGGGLVIVSFYRLQLLHRWQRALRRLFRPSPTRISMIPARTFRKEVEEAGFRVRRLIPLFRGIHGQHIALLEKIPSEQDLLAQKGVDKKNKGLIRRS